MTLAVIAGDGTLPGLVLAARPDAVLVTMRAVPSKAERPADIFARFEQLGGLFSSLRERGVRQIVLAGAMGRPVLVPTQFDAETQSMMPRLLPLLAKGDDALLRGVIAEFERAGFELIAAHEIVPDLLVKPGQISARAPSSQDQADAEVGARVLTVVGPLDMAQGCVICAGQVLGIESLYGTDALLDGVTALRETRHPNTGGVFLKAAKPDQDFRVDVPTIGPETVRRAIAAKLSAVALQEGRVQILDEARVIDMANAAGLAIWTIR